LIIAVGHLEPLKQFDHAIHAMARSRLEEEGWSLTIIGHGSEAARLSRLIEEERLTRTRIIPTVDDLESRYARASLLLLTSRLESFSLVLAESMLAGVVPIAYASDGPSFILEDHPENLVPTGDLDALADRLTRFARDPDLPPLRASLSASVEARFSPDVIVAQWREVLAPSTLPPR
jgi:glycosyltransferase involved in cell wall biosynthesis